MLFANLVVNSSQVSVKTVAELGSWLLAWVPMPKINEPLMEAALPETAGNSTMTPLLSEGNKTTGFVTWAAVLTNAGLQELPEQV